MNRTRRRSTRLASKAKQDGAADFVLEENTSNHFNLKGKTPTTSKNQRSSQKRKRAASANLSPEVERTYQAVVNGNVSPSPGGTETGVLTQKFLNGRYTKVKQVEVASPVGDEDANDISCETDSFIQAIDNLENKHAADGGGRGEDKQNVEDQKCSQDMFNEEDDAEFLEAFPVTPAFQSEQDATPKRSVRESLSVNKLSKNNRSLKSTFDKHVNVANEVAEGSKENAKGAQVKVNAGNEVDGGVKKKKRAGDEGAKQGAASKKKKKASKFKVAFTNRKAIKELANSASNELSKDDLSYMSNEEKLLLSSWGLPVAVLNKYKEKGISTLFQWQLDCLSNEKVLEGRNLLYSAPTSAGKTLVSEILMLKRVLELGRKAIMILPFVSVAREKVYSLQSIFSDAGVRVEGFMGSINPPGGFKAVDIAICTIEKANSLINRLLEEDCLADLGTLVVDELHLIGDKHRGYLLELLLTKILYMTSIKNDGMCGDSMAMSTDMSTSFRRRKYNIQVIGMSATLPNLGSLAKWLNAELYVTEFRPVPLTQRLKLENELLDEALEPIRKVVVDEIPIKIPDDIDDIIYLALETVLGGFSVLIFCPSKAFVETTATKIANQFFKIGNPNLKDTDSNYPPAVGERLRGALSSERIRTVVDQLRQCPGGFDAVLLQAVMFGIGYHHAGLTYENRDIVETAFKKGILKVIVATSTLSAGVNLPARRVMIVTPMFNGHPLDTLTYNQMCGRAGRNGIDTEGESILICPPQLKDKGLTLFQGSMPSVTSALLTDGSLTSRMKRALLEAIASRIATRTTDVRSYAKCTYLFHSLETEQFESEELTSSQINKEGTIEECISFLQAREFITTLHFEQDDKPDEYEPTRLGSACLAASFSPDDALTVSDELHKARKRFVLENELHVIYQVTPIYMSEQLKYISWNRYEKIFGKLDACEKEVAELIGINEGFIVRGTYGGVSWENEAQRPIMAIHLRFYAALALSDLVNEKSLEKVAAKYELNKGVLQNLQQTSSTFAGMVTAFCNRLGWSNLELLLSQFQERLEFGVQRELCDLVKLDCLNGRRARILYDAGIKEIKELASTDPTKVEQILHKAAPFKSVAHGGSESHIWIIGKDHLTESEAASKIVLEARNYIQIELGQGNIQLVFGVNDALPSAPLLVEKESNVADKEVIENGKGSLDAAAAAGSAFESDDFLDNCLGNEKVLNVGVPEDRNSEGEAEQCEKDAKIEVIRENGDNDTYSEELFTQRQLELEASEVLHPTIVDNHQTAIDDMFEDSFPEIIPTNISALCPQIVEEEVEVKSPVNKNHMDENVPNVNIKVSNLQHSTPVVPNNGRKMNRFTLRPDECTSPVRRVHSPDNLHRKTEQLISNHTKISFEQEQFSNRIWAEFDNGFEESVGDEFEESLGLENAQENINQLNQSLKLSESDTAAMRAIAEEDSHFESEELFTTAEITKAQCDTPNNTNRSKFPANLPVSNPRMNERIDELDGLDEEDFILTQEPAVMSGEDEDEIFEESSSDTEGGSASTCNGRSSLERGKSAAKAPTVLETTIGDKKLTAKIVYSVDMIPDDFFANCNLIGIGLKLSSKANSALFSLSIQGIGSRILGKKPKNENLNQNEPQRPHSIALYNGQDTIWVLRWSSESFPIAKRSKGKKEKGPLESLLFRLRAYNCFVSIFDCKEKVKNLIKCCGSHVLSDLPAGGKMLDPKIAKWIWEFDDEKYDISKESLVTEYVQDEVGKHVGTLDWEKEIGEAFYAWRVMTELKNKLEDNGLWNHFIDTEMPSIVPLMLMEMNGFGLDTDRLKDLKRILQFKQYLLELKAYQLAGRQFNIGSKNDLQKVLYREIGLKQMAKGTSKDVLLKLDHEIGRVVVEYRKLSNSLQRVVIPFQQERNLGTGRVHGQYSHFTCTGRVIMREPSLQTIPRDFDIEIFYNDSEISEIRNSCKIKFGAKLNTIFRELDREVGNKSVSESDSLISMRNVFVPCSDDFTLLTADYSQLELRILAHLSGDEKLLGALNRDTDVFIEIASQWKNLPKEQITSSVRQEAKGIVYGVIYGMGARTLAEQMEIEERDAHKFINQFMKTYPAIKSFMDNSIKLCEQKGYVETIAGRRRYLPLIKSGRSNEIAKAHRQAVNSRIQGTAADLVKCAMTRIHALLVSKYPKSSLPIEWTKVAKARRSLSVQGLNNGLTTQLANVVFFPILNLHDELIFEVRKSHLKVIADYIKSEMESCVKLSVKLPVVIKTGDTWGSLVPYK